MADDERDRLLRLIEQQRRRAAGDSAGAGARLDALCRVAVAELGIDSVAVAAGPDERGDFAVVAASSPGAQHCAETELGLAAGPSKDASALRRPVLVRDLRGEASIAWPELAAAAAATAVTSIYAFPLQLGALRIGVLSAYAAAAQTSSPRLRTGLLLAEIATLHLLDDGGRGPDRPGDDGLGRRLDDSVERRAEVYQAQGMVAVAAGTDLGGALSLLRAYAFASGRDLADVAGAVVRGELDLTPSTSDPRDRRDDHHQHRDEP